MRHAQGIDHELLMYEICCAATNVTSACQVAALAACEWYGGNLPTLIASIPFFPDSYLKVLHLWPPKMLRFGNFTQWSRPTNFAGNHGSSNIEGLFECDRAV
jgi:hypothetical protein